ncbi:spore germination protein KA [Oikeobacillus pervagus]|uniref:Spore germination protein KA n=1 Tax=Oikeobacillus pervagus TaxID=1325931 RepID=A0AAJ1WHB3_9BACI|nr:spore germination protein [Oikeobacillus pervagus]MDQ0216032.1 spore germination protein KA [Oikeobacillus pervagus]
MGFLKKRAVFKKTKSQTSHSQIKLSPSLKENREIFERHFDYQEDLIYRMFYMKQPDNRKCMLIFMKDITNQEWISQQIMQPLKECEIDPIWLKKEGITSLEEFVLTSGNVSATDDVTMLFDELLSGNAILLIQDETSALSISVGEWASRAIEEPTTQTVVRGPREGFTEKLSTNKALLRKRIRTNKLKIETFKLGEMTQTNVSLVFIQDLADEEIVNEARRRIQKIHIAGILESNNIEELIEDTKWTPFPLVSNTERPDVAAAALLEGKVIVMVDGTPFVLMVPVVFMQFFQTAEDYYSSVFVGSLTRLLRYLSMFIALLAPSIYVALTTFHQEMIPSQLLTNIAAQREGVPFPAFIEALLMEVTFEILREAGIRMPKAVGQAVSVVGAIVIGQAAVEAGFVSAAMVIVVSATAIASFVLPSYNMANTIRLLRFFIMGLAASFGFFGITLGLFLLIVHLCSLRSFGVSYMAPIAPFYGQDQKDTFVRLRHTSFSFKGKLLRKKN